MPGPFARSLRSLSLWCAALIPAAAAAQPALADRFARALQEAPLPGLRSAVFARSVSCSKGPAWAVALDDGVTAPWVCAVTPDQASCGIQGGWLLPAVTPEGICGILKQLDPVRSSTALAGAVSSAMRALESPGLTGARLFFQGGALPSFTVEADEGGAHSVRTVLPIQGGWHATPDLGALGLVESRAPVYLRRVDDPSAGDDFEAAHDLLFTWVLRDGGMGNNASGFERYTAVVLEIPVGEREPRFDLTEVARLPLGEGFWARSVDDQGFHQGSTFHALEAAQGEDGSALLQLACPRDPDPRSALFGPRVAAGCTRRQRTEGAGALLKEEGRYVLMGRELVRANSARIEPAARGDALELAERPLGPLEYVELRNRGRVAIDLRAVEIGETAGDAQPLFSERRCIVDAGGAVLIRFEGGSPPEHAQMPVCDASVSASGWSGSVKLYVKGTVLLTVRAAEVKEEEPGDANSSAWVRDGQGRECVQQASPGRLNQPCR